MASRTLEQSFRNGNEIESKKSFNNFKLEVNDIFSEVNKEIADLLIPILTFVISRNFSIPDYLFSSISVLIFAPIFIGMNKKDNVFCIKSTLLILGILLLQAAINVLFKTNALTNTSMKFYSFMCGILFWRVLFVLPIFLIILGITIVVQ